MENLNNQINRDLKNHLNYFLKDLPANVQEIYDYTLFPTGKLFRANLVWRLFSDLKNIPLNQIKTSDYPDTQLLASAIEIHHAYTLIHDDLPCMDNDDFRRGKPSAHKKYNEWIALLAGDGLLNLSYEILSHINHPNGKLIMRSMAQLCGPNGLIHGQYLDLMQNEDKFTFEKILEIHHLKTANLFIAALEGSAILANAAEDQVDTIINIGAQTGLAFQLIDDLTELCDQTVSHHEVEINPWIHDFLKSEIKLIEILENLKFSSIKFNELNNLITDYITRLKKILIENQVTIEGHLSKSLEPVISML